LAEFAMYLSEFAQFANGHRVGGAVSDVVEKRFGVASGLFNEP